jgi:hypothetical protein
MLGFEVSETTISGWMKRAPKDPQPAKRWLAFLRNHREAIAAMDFFTVPTLTFGFCTASSSSVMIAAAFCTSTSLATPPAPGSCSSCEKLFPTIPRPDFSYSTMTRSMAWKCQRRCAR